MFQKQLQKWSEAILRKLFRGTMPDIESFRIHDYTQAYRLVVEYLTLKSCMSRARMDICFSQVKMRINFSF